LLPRGLRVAQANLDRPAVVPFVEFSSEGQVLAHSRPWAIGRRIRC